MTREEAIERYDRIRYNLLNREDKAAVDVAFDALREQEGLENSYAQLQASFDQIYESNMAMGKALREQPRWISVEEAMPKDQSDVLVVALWNGGWQTMTGWISCVTNEWSCVTPYGEHEPEKVTHWMPLPKPPEVEV